MKIIQNIYKIRNELKDKVLNWDGFAMRVQIRCV